MHKAAFGRVGNKTQKDRSSGIKKNMTAFYPCNYFQAKFAMIKLLGQLQILNVNARFFYLNKIHFFSV
jgi:hypothetical protein